MPAQQPDLTLLMARLVVTATVLPLPGHAKRLSKRAIARDGHASASGIVVELDLPMGELSS